MVDQFVYPCFQIDFIPMIFIKKPMRRQNEQIRRFCSDFSQLLNLTS
jgi:hypothetical protein